MPRLHDAIGRLPRRAARCRLAAVDSSASGALPELPALASARGGAAGGFAHAVRAGVAPGLRGRGAGARQPRGRCCSAPAARRDRPRARGDSGARCVAGRIPRHAVGAGADSSVDARAARDRAPDVQQREAAAGGDTESGTARERRARRLWQPPRACVADEFTRRREPAAASAGRARNGERRTRGGPVARRKKQDVPAQDRDQTPGQDWSYIMKRSMRYTITIGTILGFALSSAVWAQQRDLEVTIDVVPANVAAGAAGEIKLPITLPETASPRAQDASAFGLETANRARELKGDLGREFGKEVSEAARERKRTPNLPPQSKGSPKG